MKSRPMLQYLKPLFLVVIMSVYAGTVAAADATAADPTNGAEVLRVALDNIETSLLALASGSTGMNAYGLEMLGLFLVGNFVWEVVKGMATGRMLDAFLADFLPVGVGTVCAYLFLVGGFDGKQNLAQAILETVNAIGATLAPAGLDTSTLGSTTMGAIGSALKVIVSIGSMNSADFSLGIADVLPQVMFMKLIAFLIKWLFVIGTAILILIGMGIFVATLVITQISITIGVIFMPIFVPFMTFKPLENLFDTWLKFFLTAAFMKVIGVLMLNVTGIIMTQMVALSEVMSKAKLDAVDALSVNIVLYCVLALMAAICCLVMLSVPFLTGNMIGGKGSGFSGWGALTQGAMSKGPLGGMGKPEANVGKGGNAVGSKGNMLSGVSSIVPNALKPITRAAGNAAEAALARWQPPQRPQQTGGAAGGDNSNRSGTDQNAYLKHVESVNSRQGGSGTPGASKYTIPRQDSTTSANDPGYGS